MSTPGAARIRFNFVENTPGIAAADWHRRKAGIMGTDHRDSQSGQWKGWWCGIGSGREEAGLWTVAFPPEAQGQRNRRSGGRGETQVQMPFSTDRWFPAPEGRVNFLRLAVGGWHAIKRKFCRTKRPDVPCRGQEGVRSGCRRGNQFDQFHPHKRFQIWRLNEDSQVPT